jgi:hypothetical protein
MKKRGFQSLCFILVTVLFASVFGGYGRPAGAAELTDVQRNSISMLNHLTVLTQEINASRNNRLFMEEAYSTLLNNIHPNAVDATTLNQIRSLLNTLEQYRMINVKRERLQYIFEQNHAMAIKATTVPDPLFLLSAGTAANPLIYLVSVVYTVIDARTTRAELLGSLETQYLMEGWGLDDEEMAVLHSNRMESFTHMIDIVNRYELPGDLALNEESVDRFVAAKMNPNLFQRLQFLETTVEIYRAFGDYWLVLAETYYLLGEYAKCLEALSVYGDISARIFRQDFELARTLPLAVAASGEVLDNDDYIGAATEYASQILDNSRFDDWALHYFTAQVYIDLYARSGEIHYLERAFGVVVNTVNYLIDEQKAMNAAYLTPLRLLSVPSAWSSTREERREITDINSFLNAERAAALPPVYEPLLLNLELLFALAEVLDIPQSEKHRIDSILRHNDTPIFLLEPLDNIYRFQSAPVRTAEEDIEAAFEGAELSFPAVFASEYTEITVTVTDPESGETVIFDDWTAARVSRAAAGDVGTFTATFASAAAKAHTYTEGAFIEVEITPRADSETDTFNFAFEAVSARRWDSVDRFTLGVLSGWNALDTIVFERVK